MQTTRGYRTDCAETLRECYLYDLYADPYELHNLVSFDSHTSVREWLRGLLLDKLALVEGYRPDVIAPVRTVPGGQLTVSSNDME